MWKAKRAWGLDFQRISHYQRPGGGDRILWYPWSRFPFFKRPSELAFGKIDYGS
ncbi:conserved hypothetical protein [delta proteobacterium NaphS2]|nr:conserved hypothetical protein [delta proteobacterium NaphS2]